MNKKFSTALAFLEYKFKVKNQKNFNNISGFTAWKASEVTRGSRTGPIFEGGTTPLRIDYGY